MTKKIQILFLSLFISSAFAVEPQPLSLSLHEAILLAVRTNPNVQSSQLSYTSQKFNLWVQEWQFLPHYQFQANAQTGGGSTGSANVNVQPGISWLSPIGTQASITGGNQNTGNFSPGLSLQVMQPLMRGFGKAIVESALNNAKDSEIISRLNVEGTLRNTITSIINAYLDVISAEKTIAIDRGVLKRTETSVKQTKLFIKAGHLAGNELVTVQANVASAKSRLENDKNNLIQARYALFAAIGIDPNADVIFNNLDLDALINKYHLSTLNQAKLEVLNNDIQYQTDDITLHGSTTRSLLVAEDSARWQLNFSASAVTGTGNAGKNAGIRNMFSGANQNNNVGLTLQIPIDDQVSKQAVVNAQIGLKQAELALMQEKWSKETSAINGWNSVLSAKRALYFADNAEKLQEKTYNVSYQKYLHGLIDSLELQTALESLIQAKQTFLNAQISYIKALVNMDLLTGKTLTTWNVKVRL